jgi:hypothetical protein
VYEKGDSPSPSISQPGLTTVFRAYSAESDYLAKGGKAVLRKAIDKLLGWEKGQEKLEAHPEESTMMKEVCMDADVMDQIASALFDESAPSEHQLTAQDLLLTIPPKERSNVIKWLREQGRIQEATPRDIAHGARSGRVG